MSETKSEETAQLDQTGRMPMLGRLFAWTDKPKAVSGFVYAIYAVCAGLFLAEFFYHKHVYLPIEETPGFYALFGFVVCAALVIGAKGVQFLLARDATYYAPYDVDSEDYPEAPREKGTQDG
ncbi:hypothetical protein N4R57_14050 [Rhodobacteraceae bacterium D3-12]|nr:hypothetical protein N4R57_14050 [Rhodobacteraceae bacterium D3-12]